jgi:hypothetical protein
MLELLLIAGVLLGPPGDRSCQTVLPIFPGGEPAEVIVHGHSFKINAWRRPGRQWSAPPSSRYVWDYPASVQQQLRRDCPGWS